MSDTISDKPSFSYTPCIVVDSVKINEALARNKYPKFTKASVVFDGKYLAYLLQNLKETKLAEELHAFVDSKKPTQVYFHY